MNPPSVVSDGFVEKLSSASFAAPEALIPKIPITILYR
jgi:hypothetical protein